MNVNCQYYPNGVLKEKGAMFLGLKEGIWKCYFESGAIEKEIDYKNNIKNGIYYRWFENGNLAIEALYKNGNLIGMWKEYHENGQLKEVGKYVDSEYTPIDFWDEMGNQLLKNGTGKKIEKFDYLELDVFEHYFENGKFIKEIRL